MVGLYRSARSTGRTAVAIVVESGLLYLVTQVVFVVLFALGHPAQAILAVIAVQIYVSGCMRAVCRVHPKRNMLIFW